MQKLLRNQIWSNICVGICPIGFNTEFACVFFRLLQGCASFSSPSCSAGFCWAQGRTSGWSPCPTQTVGPHVAWLWGVNLLLLLFWLEIIGLFLYFERDKRAKIKPKQPCVHVCVLSCFSCVRLCDPRHCSPPGSSGHGILQAGILEWVAMPSSRGSSWPRNLTGISPLLQCRWILAAESLGKTPKQPYISIIVKYVTIYIYIYIHTHTHIYIIYIHTLLYVCMKLHEEKSKMFETKNGLEQISSETQLQVLLQVSRLDSMAHGAQGHSSI